jgi:uncharacterized protein (TIGR00730 family)
LEAGGHVTGVLPQFMDEVEWGHKKLSEMVLVESMHVRKKLMLERADAVVALPGGCGTLEELFEAITWKRLGLVTHPIVMLNTRGFYEGVVTVLNRCIEDRFMGEHHRAMWSCVDTVSEVLPALQSAPAWSKDARSTAAVR